MGQELVDTFGGVAGLLHTGPEALKSIKGLGPAKRAELVAVLELARRALAEELKEKPCLPRRRPCATICNCSWATGRTRFLPCCFSTASTG